MILDTSFVIDLMEKDKGAIIKLEELTKKGETQLITSPTIFELYTGLARSKKPIKEKNKIIEVLSGQTIVSLDKNSAQKSGKIDGTLIKERKGIGVIDSMIAGIAILKKESVLTRNIKDFSRVEELKVEPY